MPRYFHVDRQASLSLGTVIHLQVFADVRPMELQAHLSELLPDGVTRHGDHYLVSNNRAVDTSAAIEFAYEYVRRAAFSDRPSRYQSFFATPDLDSARAFRTEFAAGQAAPIWEVEADEGFHTDMHLVTHAANTSSLVMSSFAHRYWTPHPTPSPQSEVLLRPPMTVVRHVET